jgi:hypothetical protein
LRLPGAVKEVFEERIRKGFSEERANKIMTRIRDTRGGKLYDATFGKRGRGEGPYAESIGALFDATVRRLGFNPERPAPANTFERPLARGKQLALF